METTVEFPSAGESEELAAVRALLRGTDPAGGLPRETWSCAAERDEVHRRRQALLQVTGKAMAPAAAPGLRQLPVRTTPPRRRRRAIGASLAALTAVAGAGIAVSVGGSAAAAPALPQPLTFQHGTRGAAAASLDRAAAHLDAFGQRGSGSTVYSKIQEWAFNVDVRSKRAHPYLQTTIVEGWYGADGSAQVTESGQSADALTGLASHGNAGPAHTSTFPTGSDANRNAGIPTTSTPAVMKWLHDHLAAPNAFSVDVNYGGDIFQRLAEGDTTPAQTAALYRALATLPGVFDAGAVHDREGRSGLAVGIVVSDAGSISTGTQYLVLDPHTGQVLDIEDVLGPNPPPGLHLRPGPIVDQFQLFLASGLRHDVGR